MNVLDRALTLSLSESSAENVIAMEKVRSVILCYVGFFYVSWFIDPEMKREFETRVRGCVVACGAVDINQKYHGQYSHV